MNEIDTDDTRVGTACTFTGKGSRNGRGRLPWRLIVPSAAAICVLATGAAYFLQKPPVRPDAPAPSGAAARAALATASPSSPAPPPAVSRSAASIAPPSAAHGTVAPHTQVPAVGGPSRDVGSRESHGASRQPSASSPGGPTPSRFHVQAGSFENRDGAIDLMARLRNHGYAVALIGGPPYRVWVGGYLDRGTAERLAGNLRAEGFDATPVQR
jgi:cell division septation protein DedD